MIDVDVIDWNTQSAEAQSWSILASDQESGTD